MRVIVRGVCNLPTNFGISATFRSWLMGQHLLDGPRDLATFTFDLGGHGDCRWCKSSCSVCVPSLKYVGLSFRTIWHTFDFIINRLGDLDLLTLKLVRFIVHEVGKCWCFWDFSFSIYEPTTVSDGDLATLTFHLGDHGTCRRYGYSCSICHIVYQVLSS